MKHSLWLSLLARFVHEPAPILVIDTHAGAGLYDLQDAMARRSKEADAGIARLMTAENAPAVFAPLKAAVATQNLDGELRYYPGSPLLTVAALRRGDAYLGCELRVDDQADLQALLDRRNAGRGIDANAVLTDGYAKLKAPPPAPARLIYLIDPPFERSDDYDQIADGIGQALRRRPDAIFAIWTPLKDLETFDAMLRRLEVLNPPSVLIAETRLRRLTDPMKMNGSAMILIGAPDIEVNARAAAEWIVAVCGEAGGLARVWKLGC